LTTPLEVLKNKINNHYYNEAEIMLEILDSELSRSQRAELLNFMVNNPMQRL
jgi:hypothetical protein